MCRGRFGELKRKALTCENGNTESLLRNFYQLMVTTRRRHGLPAQPIAWFQNLIRCFGPNLTISVAAKWQSLAGRYHYHPA